MKKKLFAVFLFFSVFLSGCAFGGAPNDGDDLKKTGYTPHTPSDMRGVWITYDELAADENRRTKEAFEEKIEKMFSNISDFGFNTVFVHVRAYCDAFYPSAYFPWSVYISGEQGKAPGFDPLAVMVEKAHEKKLSIHAWINPYRVSSVTDTAKLSEKNPAKIWLEKDVYDKRLLTSSGIWFNPASEDVRELIINGIKEIVSNYEVDGIHFDDYFYPQSDLFIDESDYNEYQNSGGKLTQSEWRTENVNKLVKRTYEEVKKVNPDLLFGISPSGNTELNTSSLFADVRLWGSEKGYVDYLCPQIYYGFKNKTCPFEQTAEQWKNIVTCESVKLYAGLAAYKCGTEEAGGKKTKEEKNEWIENTDMLARQIKSIRAANKYSGYVMFSYKSLFSENNKKNITKELKNVIDL